MIAILLFSQFSLADSLYTHGYYELARVEYKRQFFFYPELKTDQHARFNFGLSLLKNDDVRGIQELNRMITDFPELEPELNVSMAQYYMKVGNYYQARNVLSKTEEHDVLGFVYLLNDQFTDAHNIFMKTGNEALAREINAYIQKPKKSRGTAAFLSSICPGAGEIYAGNIRLGIMDFFLNLGSGYLIYNAMKQKKYVDAALVFTFLFQRFYFGSISNAQKSVIEKNGIERQQWLSKVKDTYFSPQDTVVRDINLDY
ncbi:unnamed protein product [marine sediment metagenome]|uniref:Outer membrane lipoprotein BamD-like domain-containing protein n=1 Tax=marine sediment metagenome TaxID=412755 RepID=X1AE63_9ZZZZ